MKRNIKTLPGFFALLVVAGSLWSCGDDNKIEPREGQSAALFNPHKEYGEVSDIDGNTYKTIAIGGQTWMAQSLRTTHYRNGDPIPHVKDSDAWRNQEQGAWCSYNHVTHPDSLATFGLLYNWYTVEDERGICPQGWRVPSREDILELYTYVADGEGQTGPRGNNTIAGGRLKESGTLHWEWETEHTDNSSGFTAVPSGRRWSYFEFKGTAFYFWATTLNDDPELGSVGNPFAGGASKNFDTASMLTFSKLQGLAIRCVKN